VSERALLRELFGCAIDAVHGARVVERALRADDPGGDRWQVLAAGKAACAMAEGARAALGERLAGGSVVTKDGHARPIPGLEVHEASHPVPDARGAAAAERALARAAALGASDRLLVLLSGGASALWSAPVAGVSLGDLRRLTDVLLRSGVGIDGINAVRKHLSRVKGGWLARAALPARVLTLAISDVAGDARDTIGSGPTAPDPTSFSDALDVIADLDGVPDSVRAHLEAGARGGAAETPKPGDACFASADYRVVARLTDALAAAEHAAQQRALSVWPLGRALAGEARECARQLAERADLAREAGADLLIAGGEPTVTVRGDGLGGRAQELALAYALERRGRVPTHALFAGSDGSDGPTDAAGGFADAALLEAARAAGLDPEASLARNDSHRLLHEAGACFVTGPTDTNVTDLALILLR
jgi:glycerate-2-kinase